MKVIKIPFGGGGLGHGNGARDAPDVIEEQLTEIFSNEQGIAPKFEFEQVDVNDKDLEYSHKNIYNSILNVKEKAVILGGDHSVSNPCFKAFAQNHKGAGIVIFDAHPDLLHFTSAKSQEDWLRALIEENVIDAENVILIGIRNVDPIEKEYINEKKLDVHYMKHIFEHKIENVCDAVMEKIKNWPAIYLSIDIDSVDPAFAPGTGYKEPGGLTSRELLYFIQRLMKLKNIKMIDIVEVDPSQDPSGITSKLAAKILTELN